MDEVKQEFRPWSKIWLETRLTVRQALEVRPMGLIYFLVIATAITEAFVNVFDKELDIGLSPIVFLFASPFIVLLGFVGWYLMSWLYTVIGRWFNGSGSSDKMRIGVGIAYIPAFVAALIQIASYSFVVSGEDSPSFVVVSLLLSLLLFVSSIWLVVIQSKAIGEVHGFSAWRGLGTLVLTTVILVACLLFVGLFVSLFLIL